MIVDNIVNCEKYYGVNDKFKKAFEFLKKAPSDLPAGRHEISGDEIYAVVQSYVTKKEEECICEGHRKYIDVQYMVLGNEFMKITDISSVKSEVVYDENKDLELFSNGEACDKIVMSPGKFAIFFPNDIHKGAIMYTNPSAIKKIIVKVRV